MRQTLKKKSSKQHYTLSQQPKDIKELSKMPYFSKKAY